LALKLIKLSTWNNSGSKNETNDGLVVGDADGPRSEDFGRGLVATTETMFSQELEQSNKRKKAVLVSVWLKESY
jgi:hypothetical protein